MEFGRLVVAMATPFRDSLELDLEKAAALARRLEADGIDSLVLSGTTGESPTLSRQEKIGVDNASLDQEFNSTLVDLQSQGLNLNNIRGGKQGQQRVAEAVAMESASRLLTRRTLERLKLIATGEYKEEPAESSEAQAASDMEAEGSPVQSPQAEAPKEASSGTSSESENN